MTEYVVVIETPHDEDTMVGVVVDFTEQFTEDGQPTTVMLFENSSMQPFRKIWFYEGDQVEDE